MCILDAQSTDCAPRLCVHSQPPVLYDQRAGAGMKQYEKVQYRCAERGAKEVRLSAIWAAEAVEKQSTGRILTRGGGIGRAHHTHHPAAVVVM
jgi:hypothetical protein